MTPFEIELITALHNISKSLDMQVKQKEKELEILKDISVINQEIACHLENIHTDMIGQEIFIDDMKELRSAIRGER